MIAALQAPARAHGWRVVVFMPGSKVRTFLGPVYRQEDVARAIAGAYAIAPGEAVTVVRNSPGLELELLDLVVGRGGNA